MRRGRNCSEKNKTWTCVRIRISSVDNLSLPSKLKEKEIEKRNQKKVLPRTDVLRSPNSFGSKNDSSAPYSWLLFFRVPPRTPYTAKRYRAVLLMFGFHNSERNCAVFLSSNSNSIYVCVSKNRGILRSVQLPPIEWLFHWVILSYEVWDTPKYCWLWLGLQGWQFLVWWERGPRLSRTDETNTTLFPTQQTVTNYLLVFCLCPLSPTLQFTRLA